MSEITINTYEGMFLFPQSATADLSAASGHVLEQLEKVGAELLAFKKWDERRLAYPIKGNKRGVYFLGYFKLSGEVMTTLERNLLLSEEALRFLITRADHLTEAEIEATEGRAQLKDEIALRSEQQSQAAEASVRGASRAERKAAEDEGSSTEEAAPAEDNEAEASSEAPTTL